MKIVEMLTKTRGAYVDRGKDMYYLYVCECEDFAQTLRSLVMATSVEEYALRAFDEEYALLKKSVRQS